MVGKANKGIIVVNNNRLKKLKLEKEKRGRKKEERKRKKRKTPQNCKSPTWRQRFITTIKNATKGKKSPKD